MERGKSRGQRRPFLLTAGALNSRETGGLLRPLPRQSRQGTAFAIAGILEVDPVVRIDVIQRNVIARAQHAYEYPPGGDLRIGRGLRYIGIVARELDADRCVLVHLVIGLAVVDVLVVVAIGTIGVGWYEIV